MAVRCEVTDLAHGGITRVGAAALACPISEETQSGASFARILAIEGYGSINMVSAVACARVIAGREESPPRNSTTEDGRSAPSGAHLDTHQYRSGRRYSLEARRLG